MSEERCKNFNHGKSRVTIRCCTDCGVVVNGQVRVRCDEAKHASRRKERNLYCCDCGKKLG